MAEYVEREALLSIYKKWLPQLTAKEDEGDKRGVETCVAVLEDFPAADVAPVVRCKNCQNLQPLEDYGWLAGECTVLHNKVTADFYCAFGKRKDGDGNG